MAIGATNVDSLLIVLSKSKEDTNKVYTLNALSKQLVDENKKDSSLVIAEQALELAKKIQFTKGIAKTYHTFSNIHWNLGDENLAAEYLKKVLQHEIDHSNERGQEAALNMLGILERLRGNFSASLEYLFRSLRINEKLNYEEHILVNYNNIGATYEKYKDHKKAIFYYRKALKIHEKNNNQYSIALVLNNLSVSYSSIYQLDTAVLCYQRSLGIFKELDLKKEMSSILNNVATIYYKQHELDSAVKYLSQALAIREELDEKNSIATTLNNLGIIQKDRKNYTASIDYFERSLALAIEKQNRPLARTIYENLSNLYWSMEDYKNSYEYLVLFSTMQDSLLNEKNFRQINELELQYETEKQEQQLEVKNAQLKLNQAEIDQKNTKVEQQKTFNYFLVFLIVIAVVIAFLLFSRYKLAQRNKQGQLEKTNLEIEQRLLRAQMNPHFIFNSLNSIQSFISENEANIAERYLSKFARLMRYILDNSSKPYISMDAEVNTLQLYLELERLRFDNKFDFRINVASNIDTEELAIPPMLAQPYIENAILHGMMYKEEKGTITIDFTCENDLVHCTIKDDGIGRKKAMEIKSKTTSAHQSRGMQVTKDRIDLMNQQKGAGIQVNITDLENENNTALGTLIELFIPCEVV
jgi:tetratricopeptide (TPR) repeat protein